MSADKVQQADADLWKAYGVKLKNTYAQGQLGKNDRFYLAPLSAAGVAAGKKIDVAITNDGVYNVADALLDIDDPVFMPTRQSYFDRARSYVGSVYLASDNNTGAQVRYNDARDKANAANTYFQKTKHEALAAYKQEKADGLTDDPNVMVWAVSNYPELAQAQEANDSATANAAAAAAAIDGPRAAAVGRYLSALTSAGSTAPNPGFNMNCSSAPASQIGSSQAGTANAPYLRPFYEIDQSYNETADGWIRTFSQNKNNPKTISFSSKDASKSSWTDLGHKESSASAAVGAYWWFFSCSYYENNVEVKKNISSEELDSSMTITLTATDIGSFAVTPGKWNPGELFGMPIVADADPNLSNPVAYITRVVLAYGVGLKFEMSSSAVSTISEYLHKASSSGGRATIFGYNVGWGAENNTTQTSTTSYDQVKSSSTSTTITIPPSDNGYPTLLAAFGTSLPTPAAK